MIHWLESNISSIMDQLKIHICTPKSRVYVIQRYANFLFLSFFTCYDLIGNFKLNTFMESEFIMYLLQPGTNNPTVVATLVDLRRGFKRMAIQAPSGIANQYAHNLSNA